MKTKVLVVLVISILLLARSPAFAAEPIEEQPLSTDLYKRLAVEPAASDQVIKKTYRRLAMKYHPDRNMDDSAEAKFKKIKEAYEVLKVPSKRAQYDSLQNGYKQEQPRGPSNREFDRWGFDYRQELFTLQKIAETMPGLNDFVRYVLKTYIFGHLPRMQDPAELKG